MFSSYFRVSFRVDFRLIKIRRSHNFCVISMITKTFASEQLSIANDTKSVNFPIGVEYSRVND